MLELKWDFKFLISCHKIRVFHRMMKSTVYSVNSYCVCQQLLCYLFMARIFAFSGSDNYKTKGDNP